MQSVLRLPVTQLARCLLARLALALWNGEVDDIIISRNLLESIERLWPVAVASGRLRAATILFA
jgi:hypothetical protein